MIKIAKKKKNIKPKGYQHQSSRKEENKQMVKEYAKIASDLNAGLRGGSTQTRSMTPARIRQFLANPEDNADNIAQLMKALYKQNGIVKSIIDYFSTMVTYNHNIFPVPDVRGDMSLSNDINDYIVAADHLSRYQLKNYAPYFVRQTLLQGVSYFYEISNTSGVVYMEFPPDWCRIATLEDGVYRWMIDISKINGLDNLDILPTELRNAIEQGPPTNDEGNTRWVDNYYIVGKKGFAITFDANVMSNGGTAVSEFASLLLDSIDLERAKENVKLKDDIDTIRLIHGELPKDKEGNIMMPPDQAQIWRDVLSRGLPDGIAAVVTPFEINSVGLSGAGDTKAYSTVNDAQKQLYKSSGVPGVLLGEDSQGSNVVRLSIMRDSAWVYSKILPNLTAYYNFAMSTLKTENNMKWRVKIIEQNEFFKDETIKELKDAVMTVGASRTDYLAAIGLSPIEIYSKLYMEQKMIDIDELLVPRMTSYTMSGNAIGKGEAGRPTTNNPTDDTERINDST